MQPLTKCTTCLKALFYFMQVCHILLTLNREDTKHTFVYFTDFEVIPAEVNAIKQILNKQDSTRPIYTFIALRTIILQSVHGVNKSLSFIIKHADICSYHRKNT